MEYGNHKKHSAGARNVKARAKRALLLPSLIYCFKRVWKNLYRNLIWRTISMIKRVVNGVESL